MTTFERHRNAPDRPVRACSLCAQKGYSRHFLWVLWSVVMLYCASLRAFHCLGNEDDSWNGNYRKHHHHPRHFHYRCCYNDDDFFTVCIIAVIIIIVMNIAILYYFFMSLLLLFLVISVFIFIIIGVSLLVFFLWNDR